MRTSKILTGLGVLIAVVAVGLGIGWLASRGTPAPVVDTPPLAASIPEVAHSPVARARPVMARPPLTTEGSFPAHQAAPPSSSPTVAMTNTSTNWEDKLDEILGSEAEDTNKVTELFAMFPNLPADGQEEVAQHLSNLVEDENYSKLGELLKDAKLDDSVLEVLMADLLNRPNAAKLPLLMDIVQNPDHPKRDEAKDLLELYLDEDYSSDPAKLKQKITDWLKENPD